LETQHALQYIFDAILHLDKNGVKVVKVGDNSTL
jgi:hypothetical protein